MRTGRECAADRGWHLIWYVLHNSPTLGGISVSHHCKLQREPDDNPDPDLGRRGLNPDAGPR